MSMNQIPTLIIGIGGVGCKIAASISDLLSEESRKYVGIIGMDTNINDLSKLKDKHKMEIIQTSDDINVDTYLSKHPEYKEWFPDISFLRQRTMVDGAGQVRTLSRIACLASQEGGRFAPILSELTRIRKVDGNPNSKKITVMFVGSITGGTGAGIFLQMPFYIRNLIRTQAGIERCVIRGMFVGPDILEDVQPAKINKDSVCVNGYSCLKELNAFYMRPIAGKELTNNLRLEFYNHNDFSVQNVPYDYLYLIEKSGEFGAMGNVQVDEVINYISRVVFTLLFSPVTADALSIEDNFAMSLISRGAMNRYAGAGMCRLVYPVSTAQEYVALSTVRDLVQNEWMLIDQEFDVLKKSAIIRKKSDSTVIIPEIKTEYVKKFRAHAFGENAKLGHLVQEAFIKQDNNYISKASEFIRGLETKIDDFISSDEVLKYEEACKVDDQRMKKFSDAQGHVDDVWQAMRQYVQFAKLSIVTIPNGFADDLFPPTEEVMRIHKDKSECIYQYLTEVHPVTARFLIYDIINRLEEMIEELKVEITGVDLMEYTQKDYDNKTDGKQDPNITIALMREKRLPLWKILGPLGDAINSEEKAIVRLKRKLRDISYVHVNTTRDFMANSIKYSVAQTVLERMLQLADNYNIFFSTVASRIDRNNDNIARLENISFPFGQEGLYCSKVAFEKMAAEYSAKSTQLLSSSTKKAIFDQIYHVQSREFGLSSVSETPAEKEQRVQENKNRLEAVFNTAVVESIRNDVKEHGAGIVNLNARQAMIKEFELESHLIPSDSEYNSRLAEYAQRRVEVALMIANPMITTERLHEDTELTFLAVSPSCSETDSELRPDTAQTAKFYLRSSGPHTTVIIDEEFANTELVCLRLAYNFTIEDLVKYKDGSRNALAYSERILDLGSKRSFGYTTDGITFVVNPHLDCRWHEEGFVPAISQKQRDIDHLDNLKAFVYALGFDLFKLLDDDDNPDDNGNPRPTWFAFTNGYAQFFPIKKSGKLIGNSYADLYDSIQYNGVLKKSILREAKKIVSQVKGYNTTEKLFSGLLDNNLFIEDLVQADIDKPKENDMNIFDIFLTMLPRMAKGSDLTSWNELFRGLILTLWEFCGVLFDNNVAQINKAVRIILMAIYENSIVGKKQGEGLSSHETALKSQYEALLKERYSEE